MNIMKKIISIFLILLITLVIFAGCGASNNNNVIRIGNKNFTEQRITGQMLAVYLESKGYKTEVSELAGTMLCFNALTNEDIDIYAEYTGSVYAAILKQTDVIGIEETFDYVKSHCEDEYGVTWLKTLGWNNTYVLSVMPETAEEYNLKNISDLIPIAQNMVIGSDAEFVNRVDGLPGMIEKYKGLKFKDAKSMDQGLTYQALVDGKLNINTSFSTDGRIAKFGLVNLIDDKNFFPPYYVTPIMRVDYAKENPEIVEALEELADQWTEEEMQKYNLMGDEGTEPKDVAILMLQDKGLIE